MWYNNIPHVEFNHFIYQALGLFSDTLNTMFGLEALRFFLVFLVFLIVFGLFAWLAREGRKGRL